MIVILLLSMNLLAAALPKTRELDSAVIDGVEGMLFEIPEYEDPELMEYEVSAIGGLPILSLIELPKTGPRSYVTNTKDTKVEEKGVMAETILELGEIIQDLQMLRANIPTGNAKNHREALAKAIRGLQKLEDSLTPDIRLLLTAMQQSLSHMKPFIVSATKKPSMPPVVNDYLEVDALKPAATENSTVAVEEIEHSGVEVKGTSSPLQVGKGQDGKEQKKQEVGVKTFKSKWAFNLPL